MPSRSIYAIEVFHNLQKYLDLTATSEYRSDYN